MPERNELGESTSPVPGTPVEGARKYDLVVAFSLL